MKVTILFDNKTSKDTLKAAWGFSCLVEAAGKKILFDTGADGNILLSNMKRLNVNPAEVEDIFISHFHWDHIGGLIHFLELNPHVTLWVPSFVSELEELRSVTSIIEVKKPCRLYEGINSTGVLEETEQSLCIDTTKGIVIIAGCSHPPMERIIDTASHFGDVYGIIGGLHGNKPETLKALKLICATHCTHYISEIQALYPERIIKGGVGSVIEID